jgi:phosphatidylserine/phosphatidylglycerophosphate/cardiolipin synthase-like enzyme
VSLLHRKSVPPAFPPPIFSQAMLSGGDPFKAGGFTPGYPTDIRTYYSPVDDVHGALLATIKSARHSIIVGMYGWDDPELQAAILEKMKDGDVYVQLTLDKTQASGKHEKELLQLASFPATSVAIGQSEKHAIIHIKCLVVDNAVLVTGSTNWSAGGEDKQDNACVIISDAYVAGEASSRISAIHANILTQTTHQAVKLRR